MLRSHSNRNNPSRSAELVQKRLRLFEICGVKAFGEPAVDRPEEFTGLILPTVGRAIDCEAERGAQFEPAAPLLSRDS